MQITYLDLSHLRADDIIYPDKRIAPVSQVDLENLLSQHAGTSPFLDGIKTIDRETGCFFDGDAYAVLAFEGPQIGYLSPQGKPITGKELHGVMVYGDQASSVQEASLKVFLNYLQSGIRN